MSTLGSLSVVVTVSVLISYLNHRFIKMPSTIAIMVGAIGLSLILIGLGNHGLFSIEEGVKQQLEALDFHDILMFGMLPFLLFAGALTVDLQALANRKWEIGILATMGTLLSTFLVAIAINMLLSVLGNPIPFIYCLLFGALISPTDPIAVIAMLKSLGASKELDALVGGESLFNDGVAIVIFLTIYHIAFSGGETTAADITLLFMRQAIGGICYGFVLGLVAYWLMSEVDDPHIEILLTMAVVTGGYGLAEELEVSGPLSMVVAGIFIGNYGRKYNMSAHTREHLDSFWELIDELLNAALFFIVGLELILLLPLDGAALIQGLLSIPIVLLSRLSVVAAPFVVFKKRDTYPPYVVSILTWGGLRGGLALAMALALPKTEFRPTVLVMTYACVVFSVVVQGMTVKPLVEKSIRISKSMEKSNKSANRRKGAHSRTSGAHDSI